MTFDVCVSYTDCMPVSIYLAGPLFSLAERDFNERLARALGEAGYEVLLPQERCRNLGDRLRDIYHRCVADIERSDVVVAVFDGPDVDSGTAFEVGYARAQNKPVIGLRTDTRACQGDGPNAMLRFSVRYIDARDRDFADMTSMVVEEIGRSLAEGT
ncbi:MAG: Nucleoside 2-deoxyribosyltransferase [Syntrophorhabdus sp. PtaU1.Bin153]|nr:MAG: Nucleoside 2-deoxyribosyltransferase [Syntrophorhabdus sp. PtaU1.Bin153]